MSKSSRPGRSSSQGEIGMFRPFESPPAFFEKKRPAPVRNSKPAAHKPIKDCQARPPPGLSVETKKSSQCIFTVGSPDRQKSDDGKSKIKKPAEGFGEFLKNCFLCSKTLGDKFYMYGYLGAFCTPECREDQMALDGFEEEIAKDYAIRLKNAESLLTKNTSKMGSRR